MGALDFLLRKSAHTLDKRIILSRKYNTVLGSDANIRDVIFEALFLTLFKILFRLINRVSCFLVKLLLPLQENILSALKQSRETIQDVTAIPAVVLAQFLMQ